MQVETIARATSAALERKSRDDTSFTAAASHAPDIVQSVSDLGSGAWAYGGSGEEIAVLLSGGVDSSVALEL
jgi:tRNA(Ile)-lysidine synthase TilS/MesJ